MKEQRTITGQVNEVQVDDVARPAQGVDPALSLVELPRTVYPPEIGAGVPGAIQHDAAGQRQVLPRQIDPAGLPAAGSFVSAAEVIFPVPVTRLRIVAGTAGMAIGVGFGRPATPTDYDDLARFVADGVTIEVPALRRFTFVETTATDGTGGPNTLVIGYAG